MPRTSSLAEARARVPLWSLEFLFRHTAALVSQIQPPSPWPGHRLLTLDASLVGEAYRLQVDSKAVVAGGSYGAVALGTASLLLSGCYWERERDHDRGDGHDRDRGESQQHDDHR